MLEANLIKMYEQSFRDNREMSAVTDYFTGETYSYYGFAKEVAKLHILFDEAGIKPGDKIVLCGFGGGLTWGAHLFEWNMDTPQIIATTDDVDDTSSQLED